MERLDITPLLTRVRGLAVLRGVVGSSAARDFLDLLELLEAERTDPDSVAVVFGRLWEGLALEDEPLLPDAWQSHLVGRILDDENPFSLGAERGRSSPMVLDQARLDLRTLRALFDLNAETLLGMIEEAVPGLAGVWVPWTNPTPDVESPRHTIARKLSAAEDWEACVQLLAGHYSVHGAGSFGRHRVFQWREEKLRAVVRPDPVRLAGLISYEQEREPLILNTERFLSGLPAHHALLYGPPGTGKSSTVKAVLNEYAASGLRLVEVKKEDLAKLARVLENLRGRGPRFVVFLRRRPFLRRARGRIQGPQGAPRRQRRGPPRKRQNLRHLQPQEPDPGVLLRPRGRRRPRPRHHARKTLPGRPLRPAPDLPLPQPVTLPGNSSRHSPSPRPGNPQRCPTRTRPPLGPLACRPLRPHRETVHRRARRRDDFLKA